MGTGSLITPIAKEIGENAFSRETVVCVFFNKDDVINGITVNGNFRQATSLKYVAKVVDVSIVETYHDDC